MLLFMIAQRFSRDTRGSVALIFGLGFVGVCLAMALAIDSSRSINVNTKLQAALDSAALASAKMLDDDNATDADVRTLAQTYYTAHLSQITMDGLSIGTLNTVINRSTSTVKLSTVATLSSMFGNIAGLSPTIVLTPESETTYNSRKIEISLVLDITGSMYDLGKIDSLKTAAKDLVDVLFATNPEPGAIRIALVPYSASVNAGSFKTGVTGNWFSADSCVVERFGSNQTTDRAPSSGNYLEQSSVAANPQYSCPSAAVEPLTDLSISSDRTAFKNRIDAMTPVGGTAGHIGLAWGWYMLSNNWASVWPSDQRPRPASPDVVKAVILMTDGEFNTSYGSINMNSTDPMAAESSPNQALALCDGIKTGSANIQLFTVGFHAPANAETMLKTCSGTANFFDASSTSDLITSFREIAERLTTLRVTS